MKRTILNTFSLLFLVAISTSILAQAPETSQLSKDMESSSFPSFEETESFQNNKIYSRTYEEPIKANEKSVDHMFFWLKKSANKREGNPHDLNLFFPQLNLLVQSDYYWSRKTNVNSETGEILKTRGDKQKTYWNNYRKDKQRDMLRWSAVKAIHRDFTRMDTARHQTNSRKNQKTVSISKGNQYPFVVKKNSESNNPKEIDQVKYHWSPIIVPLNGKARLDQLTTDKKQVRFDLNGDGTTRIWTWVKPQAGILVWDPNDNHNVTSGHQLFGNFTWGKQWDHGYQPLATLDTDSDGTLSGKELEKLSIWRDTNQNGFTDSGEIKSLKQVGIKELSVQFKKEGPTDVYSPNGVTFQDGTQLTTYDWFASPNHLPKE